MLFEFYRSRLDRFRKTSATTPATDWMPRKIKTSPLYVRIVLVSARRFPEPRPKNIFERTRSVSRCIQRKMKSYANRSRKKEELASRCKWITRENANSLGEQTAEISERKFCSSLVSICSRFRFQQRQLLSSNEMNILLRNRGSTIFFHEFLNSILKWISLFLLCFRIFGNFWKHLEEIFFRFSLKCLFQ